MTTKGTYDIGSNQHEKKGKYKVKGLAKGQTAKSTKSKKPLNPSFDKAEPNYDEMETNRWGDKRYTLNGKLHRIDGPAVEVTVGDKYWYQDGKRHRTDGPAVEENGDKYWYQHGEFHRTDGPAVETANGVKVWYQNNELHRTDGPAIEWADGSKEWFQHDEHCRPDGPTIEWADSVEPWYPTRLPSPQGWRDSWNR
jgi:hypothetical protein